MARGRGVGRGNLLAIVIIVIGVKAETPPESPHSLEVPTS